MMLETPRLILRLPEAADAPALSAYLDNKEYSRYTTTKPDPDFDMAAKIADRLRRHEEEPKKLWPFVVTLRDTGEVVGDIRIFPHEKFHGIGELGYGLNPRFWGRGYMAEAAKAMIDYGHDVLKMHRLVIRADSRNIPSWRVAEKAGMQYEGAVRYEFMTWRGFMPELKIYASVKPELVIEEIDR